MQRYAARLQQLSPALSDLHAACVKKHGKAADAECSMSAAGMTVLLRAVLAAAGFRLLCRDTQSLTMTEMPLGIKVMLCLPMALAISSALSSDGA